MFKNKTQKSPVPPPLNQCDPSSQILKNRNTVTTRVLLYYRTSCTTTRVLLLSKRLFSTGLLSIQSLFYKRDLSESAWYRYPAIKKNSWIIYGVLLCLFRSSVLREIDFLLWLYYICPRVGLLTGDLKLEARTIIIICTGSLGPRLISCDPALCVQPLQTPPTYNTPSSDPADAAGLWRWHGSAPFPDRGRPGARSVGCDVKKIIKSKVLTRIKALN